jgi:hypothetical protein
MTLPSPILAGAFVLAAAAALALRSLVRVRSNGNRSTTRKPKVEVRP